MLHYMKLNAAPFDMIEGGSKTFELRLWDEKRRQIGVGDEIVFTHADDPARALHCRVVALHIFPSFAELYSTLPLLKCGYTELDVAAASHTDMELYYTRSQQRQYGVVGIELALI